MLHRSTGARSGICLWRGEGKWNILWMLMCTKSIGDTLAWVCMNILSRDADHSFVWFWSCPCMHEFVERTCPGQQFMMFATSTGTRIPWSMIVEYKHDSHAILFPTYLIASTRNRIIAHIIRPPRQKYRSNGQSNHTADSRELRPAISTMGYGKKRLPGTN